MTKKAEGIEVPRNWDEEINTAAKRWLAYKKPSDICPAINYLGISYSQLNSYCINICHRIFPEADGICPCMRFKLKEVKKRVEKVIKEWERENERKIENAEGYASLDSNFAILKMMQEMAESPGPAMSKRQEVIRSIVEAENR
ncbi:MAG: hypothetical protein U9Q72_03695 [Patescibacteria group bacterium]|nr:hypothetical protein [Patescibacteria group bacterium]